MNNPDPYWSELQLKTQVKIKSFTDLLYRTAGYSPSVAHRVAICSAHLSKLMVRPDGSLGL